MFKSSEEILARVSPREKVLLAVSGGADSLAMLKWFVSQNDWHSRIVAAHVNHNLRDDADSVVNLVSSQAESLKVPFVFANVDVPATLAERNESVEACARRLRYLALEEIRTSQNCALVVTAHTQDDDAETVLMKLKMNSSWYECTGIPIQRGKVLRPFLGVTRAELRDLISADDEYDIDPMNEDSRFLRVQARATLKHESPASIQLSRHGRRIQSLQEITSRLVKTNNNISLSNDFSWVSGLEKLPKNLYLEDLDFLAVELKWAALLGQPNMRLKSALRRQVVEFLRAGNFRSSLPLAGGIELHRAGRKVWLASRDTQNANSPRLSEHVVLTPDVFRDIESGVLSVESGATQKIEVRRWTPGERFRPVARRNRKISDWLAEAGVHPAVRADWPVICQNDVIIAVPGLGIAEHVKPHGEKSVVNIHWKAHPRRDQQVSR